MDQPATSAAASVLLHNHPYPINDISYNSSSITPCRGGRGHDGQRLVQYHVSRIILSLSLYVACVPLYTSSMKSQLYSCFITLRNLLCHLVCLSLSLHKHVKMCAVSSCRFTLQSPLTLPTDSLPLAQLSSVPNTHHHHNHQ